MQRCMLVTAGGVDQRFPCQRHSLFNFVSEFGDEHIEVGGCIRWSNKSIQSPGRFVSESLLAAANGTLPKVSIYNRTNVLRGGRSKGITEPTARKQWLQFHKDCWSMFCVGNWNLDQLSPSETKPLPQRDELIQHARRWGENGPNASPASSSEYKWPRSTAPIKKALEVIPTTESAASREIQSL